MRQKHATCTPLSLPKFLCKVWTKKKLFSFSVAFFHSFIIIITLDNYFSQHGREQTLVLQRLWRKVAVELARFFRWKKRKRLLNVGFPTEKVLVSVFLVRYHHLDAGNRRCFLQWYWWLLWALPLLLLLMWLGWQWLWGAAGGRQSRRLLLASGGPIATNKMGDHVHRDWKYNGGVFLVANTAQSLQKRRKVNKINKEILLQCSKVSLRTNRK